MPVALFPLRGYQLFFFLLLGTLVFTCFNRVLYFDDAWFAEQSYWLIQDGRVRSELFRGLNHWEDRIYVYHKLFIYSGALVMSVFGVSVMSSKMLSVLCGGIMGWFIWHHCRKASPEQAWVAVLLYTGCGTLIRYVCVNRPEIMCALFGLASYLALDQSKLANTNVSVSALLAGLAALTHLNGIIYIVSGIVWLFLKEGRRSGSVFGLISGGVLSLYALDAVVDGQIDRMVEQFVHDPATQQNFDVRSKLAVMLNYHQLFFHSEREAALSMVVLLSLLLLRRHVRIMQPIVLYSLLLVATFWLLTKSNFDVYYVLFVPSFAILAATVLTTYPPQQPKWVRQVSRVVLVVYFGIALVSIGFVLRENYRWPPIERYNEQLARHMPHRHTKIIAPISFFFGQMDNYSIRGLTYYYHMNKRKTIPLSTFFAEADRNAVEYIVSDNPLNDSYYIPPDAPPRIGAYQKIYQDERTSIYAHR